jgi:phospholipase D1/2
MMFRPGQNVWRIERADRATVLIDGAAYFGAVRQALLKAQHTVLIAGWDIHSRTRLVGESGTADDGYPEIFVDFLTALCAERPRLEIRLLLWDFSLLYATERDAFPTYTLRWNTPPRIRLCMDDAVPIGSSQHQKLVIVDDAVAFSGGLDITIRRWDTSAHRLHDSQRVDPAGKPYGPFHDVQMVVDGAAARALSHLLRERWACAALERLPAPVTQGDAQPDTWPDGVAPDFTDVDVGISRTQPRYEEQVQVDEVERLFLDMIDRAERTIYIENQYLTSVKIAERLAQRLRDKPQLEALIITPKRPDSWLEVHSMVMGRIRFTRILEEAARGRVRLMYPEVSDGEQHAATMIHAKVMVIDDCVLRIGSANLNNRSMGTDTECDLTIDAANDAERERIVHIRNTLLGDHCGATADEVAAELVDRSLLQVAGQLSRNGHRLCRVEDGAPDNFEITRYINGVADPERPIGAEEFVSNMLGGYIPSRHAATVLRLVAVGALVLMLALVWHFVPLAQPGAVGELFEALAQSRWAPFAVVAAFVIGGLVCFPLTVLIAATAAAFGPWVGFAYASVGALTSAVVVYGVGAAIGKRTLRDILGPRLNRVRQRVAKRGVLAIVAVRLLPIAPYSIVNLVAGASGISLIDFVAGTLIGLAPGMLVISALGHQLARILIAPTATDLALLAAAVIGWIGLSVGAQMVMSKYWGRKR